MQEHLRHRHVIFPIQLAALAELPVTFAKVQSKRLQTTVPCMPGMASQHQEGALDSPYSGNACSQRGRSVLSPQKVSTSSLLSSNTFGVTAIYSRTARSGVDTCKLNALSSGA
tara:strand:+ start:35632 stop:35970 length:339 start_codon:yes stop_codon:yes gene_type:complete